jgi:hypothetical protein
LLDQCVRAFEVDGVVQADYSDLGTGNDERKCASNEQGQYQEEQNGTRVFPIFMSRCIVHIDFPPVQFLNRYIEQLRFNANAISFS